VNHLLSEERTRYRLGPTSIATFWSVGEGELNPLDLLAQADPQAVKDLLSSVHTGERGGVRHVRYADTGQFHTLVLGSNVGRAIVLDYLEVPLERVRVHLAAWFQDLAVDDGAEVRYPGLWQLKAALAPTASGDGARRLLDRWEADLSPQVGPKLLRAAMNRTPLAFDLFALAIRRNHTDPPASPRSQRHSARASLLKLYLNRTSPGKEETPMTPGLDRHRTEPAYRCGRLLSKLDEIQDAAIPGVKSGAVEKAYARASTAPALVFPGLLRTARYHLAKLERDKPGYKVRLEQDLQEILDKLPDFPRTLDLTNQGLFSLGFYHQQAERYRGKSQDEADEE
jgi:CRISPR-associated protein Csd1